MIPTYSLPVPVKYCDMSGEVLQVLIIPVSHVKGNIRIKISDSIALTYLPKSINDNVVQTMY